MSDEKVDGALWVRTKKAQERYDDISKETLASWIRNHGFPKPMKVSPGAPDRFNVRAMDRWDEARARKRHRPIHRGAIAKMLRNGGGDQPLGRYVPTGYLAALLASGGGQPTTE